LTGAVVAIYAMKESHV